MRLDILEHGHRWPARVFKKLARATFREEVDDVVKTAMHRPEFFGRHFLAYVNEVLRGPSYWTAAERERMAVLTSQLNECPFCARVHTETARIESRGKPDRPELAAMLTMLGKVVSAPDDVTPADVDAVRAAGVPDEAIVDALHVTVIFNVANRLANAFDWTWDSDEHVVAGARALHLFRYKLPPFVLR